MLNAAMMTMARTITPATIPINPPKLRCLEELTAVDGEGVDVPVGADVTTPDDIGSWARHKMSEPVCTKKGVDWENMPEVLLVSKAIAAYQP